MSSSVSDDLEARFASCLEGARVKRICRPDSWSLGVAFGRGKTLGFCFKPGSLAAAVTSWEWPRGDPPSILNHRLKGRRLSGVEFLPGEPIVRFRFASEGRDALIYEGLGRSANLLLLDADGTVVWSARTLSGSFRRGRPGETYSLPPAREGAAAPASSWLGSEQALREDLVRRCRASREKTLRIRLKALEKRARAVEGDREEGIRWIEEESLAQALLATGDLARRGESSREVTDYRKDPPQRVPVPLNPAYTVRENAERMFRRCKRGKARLRRIGTVLEGIRKEQKELSKKIEELGSVESPEDLCLSPAPPASGDRENAPTVPRGVVRVQFPDGYVGYGGKSARGNDAVTFRIGRGSDFWFHADDYPGSHLIVRNPARLERLPAHVETEAALHAARNSKAPPGNRVAVLAAQCKNIRPVPGSPGRVMVARGRTIFVELPR